MPSFQSALRFFRGPDKQHGPSLVRYLLPFVAVGAALGSQLVVAWILPKGVSFPFVVLYLASLCLTAWFGGYVPGVIACLLMMIGLPFALTPGFRLASVAPGQVTLVLILSIVISLVAQTQRRKREVLIHADELDKRVQSRTAELAQAVEALKSEIAQHKRTAQTLQTQLERLNLLDQITRAIGERQDVRSIFQVVIRSLEDSLPIDFGCVCLYAAHAAEVVVNCVGVRSEALATELAMADQSHISLDQNGLSQCVRGRLVYEQDVSQMDSPFPQRLARSGLAAFVAAPLLFESQVFGILIAARREPNSFSSGECEFLRQLSEHVALASHQSEVYSALQQAYDDLRQTQQAVMQQERLRALGQMASGIAHDINNAISPVALYTEMLLEQETGLSKRTREYLETTQRAIGDVAHTVARMREFYRQHEAELVLSPVDLSVLAQQVIDLTRARWSDMPQQRGIVIDLRPELGPSLPPVAGIESEIREALINLVFNAVDAMPEGGKLTIRTKTSASSSNTQQVDVEVVDSGVGMDEETRRRCLEPFFTTKGERGTGLGLAMVYGVTRRHNADIEMESAIGQGTTVRLRFPVAVSNATEPQSAQPQPMPRRLRILSVDDDPLLIKSLRDALEADGHAVVTASGGQEGIDVFRAAEEGDEHFAVVITDLGMPYVDGRKVASAIKRDSPSTPVILLTGWGQRLVAEGDIPPNVDRVLNKPPKLRELRAALAELAGAAVPAGAKVPE
jgi:signal transduction histidine kinase/ActR/RegA family two-component response regulator